MVRAKELIARLSLDRYDVAAVAGLMAIACGVWILLGHGWALIVVGVAVLAYAIIGSR